MTCELPFAHGTCGPQAAAEAHAGLPPVERWHPAHCGDSGMRIARDGTWFHQGAPIGRPGLVRLFSTILRKDEDGFMLVTPAEKLSIAVEDAPFLAVLMTVGGRRASASALPSPPMSAIVVAAGPDHPLRFTPDPTSGAPVPYLHVRRGLEAKLARPVYYQLVELAVTRDGGSGRVERRTFFRLAVHERSP